MRLQHITDQLVSWLITHGFQPNNREWAGLILLAIFAAFVFWNSQTRSTLLSAAKVATGPKLLTLWIVYIIWILLFVLAARQIGIWRPALTKDTFLWGVSSGLILLGGFTDAMEIDYFKRECLRIVSATIVVEYFMNFSPFSVLAEIILQVILLIAIALPAGANEAREKEVASKVRIWTLAIVSVVVVTHTLLTLHASWQTIDWKQSVVKAVWPIILSVWVLILTFPLSVYAAYEELFLRLDMYRDDTSGAWKAKLGIVLALKFRLKWIHEATKGGDITYHVSHTNSISTAYKEAKRHR